MGGGSGASGEVRLREEGGARACDREGVIGRGVQRSACEIVGLQLRDGSGGSGGSRSSSSGSVIALHGREKKQIGFVQFAGGLAASR
jgi:hypothetical protein